MPDVRVGGRRLIYLTVLWALALLPGLGSSVRLTYHEAFVAQGAREILASGNWAYPTIGGLPWLEKPPLPWWLVAGLGHYSGGVTESIARIPSALAALGIILGVATLAARHFGSRIGLIAGAVQATTAWTVLRGRLAEADILLACLITWSLIAFDRLMTDPVTTPCSHHGISSWHWYLWRWMFFVLLGVTAIVKGIGFGAVLILSVVGATLLWQRNWVLLRRLQMPVGWIMAAVIALWWPILIVAWHGYGTLSLWMIHVSDRLLPQQVPGQFASEPLGEYFLGLVGQALPWTPLALVGAWRSVKRAVTRIMSMKWHPAPEMSAVMTAHDRLLWVWAVVPVGLLVLAPVKNAHYVISAQVPWSIWAALGLAHLGEHLQLQRYRRTVLNWTGCFILTALAMSYGFGLWLVSPWFDHHSQEWAFYEDAGRQIPAQMPLTLFYDDWDRNPYQSPFGPIPHDLAVRLFYLGRPVCWHAQPGSLRVHDHLQGPMTPMPACSVDDASLDGVSRLPVAIIGRDRDLPMLEQLGHVEMIARGPSVRADRTYSLFCITPSQIEAQAIAPKRPQMLR